MKFHCQIKNHAGAWSVAYQGPDVGPIQVTAPTREEAVRKMKQEIRYWLEMCPCSGQNYSDVAIGLVEEDGGEPPPTLPVG